MQNKPVIGIPLTALLVLALTLSACGGDERPPGAATAATTTAAQEPSTTERAAGDGGGEVDACALLSDEEIAEATTHSVQSEQAGSVQGIFANGCEWQLADDAGVSVGVISPGGRSYYEKFFEPFIGDGVTGPEERVEGIADKAARFDTGDMMAVHGDTLVNVSYLKPQATDVNSESVTEKLIRAALANLP